MKVYFWDAVAKRLTDIGAFGHGQSGMDVSPMDIPLKGDFIKDDFNRFWEVIGREHYWTGTTHEMTLHLQRL